jgi:hypothetical protein
MHPAEFSLTLQEAAHKILVSPRYGVALTINLHWQGSSFATGVDVQEKRKRVLVISTGSKSVDAVLGGMFLSHNRSTRAVKESSQEGLCRSLSPKVRLIRITFVVSQL